MAHRLVTERLVLRPWSVDDADAALRAYGDAEVARWLAPAMDRVSDLAAMRVVLRQWVAEDARMLTPAGRWAIELPQEGRVIGGATLQPGTCGAHVEGESRFMAGPAGGARHVGMRGLRCSSSVRRRYCCCLRAFTTLGTPLPITCLFRGKKSQSRLRAVLEIKG